MGIAQGVWEKRVRAKDPARFRAARLPATAAEVARVVFWGAWPARGDGVERDSSGCVVRQSQDIV